MKYFAVLNSNIVTDIVTADNIFPVQQLYSNDDVIEITNQMRYPQIGARYANGDFSFPRPFPSWIFDESSLDWVPPVARPEDEAPYIWDEDILNWVKVDVVDPSTIVE